MLYVYTELKTQLTIVVSYYCGCWKRKTA